MRLRLLPLCLLALGSIGAAPPPVDRGPEFFGRIPFRNVGPVGGRTTRSCGVPGDPLVYYVGAAAGGLWKSEDGGLTWKSLTDDLDLNSVGSIAVAPSDANVIYVGGGEANVRGNVEAGNGIWKSTDAGKTWKHVWKQEGQIGTMIVHPKNPDVAFAAVFGKAFGPSKQRGVYRTTDGGKTWKPVLQKDEDTGASDVCFDPNNPRILFAGMWQARRRPWEMVSGGPGSGLYVSRDGGDTWTQLVPFRGPKQVIGKGMQLSRGLPGDVWGKIGVAVAPSDSKRVYALIEAEEGGLFRSDDGGDSWTRVNKHPAIRQRAWYYTTLTVHPTDADVVYFPQVPLLVSRDGGKSIARVIGPAHNDNHDLWIDPKNPKRMINSSDGGIDITADGGKSWFSPPLPLAQLYRLSVDNAVPYNVACTVQDMGTARGPSNSLLDFGIPLSSWHPVGGGEAGSIACDPVDSDVVYAGEYSGYLSRYDHSTRQARSIGIYPFNTSGHAAKNLKHRFQWTAPIVISPHDHKTVYHAANVLFMTSDAGRKWAAISKDMTRNDKSKQGRSGGPITGDNTGVEVYCTIFAVAESPKTKGVIWAGSDDGLVHVTRDGGKNWTNVTEGLQKVGLPDWATITGIEASPFDDRTAYVVADNHRLDDRKPYLFVTTDGGKTWRSLTAKMAAIGYLQVVRIDPTNRNLLYLGGEFGLALSRDGGSNWQRLKQNLPTIRVVDLRVKDNDLVVATSGRGVWIYDDLTPVRTEPKEWTGKDVHLFATVPAYRFRSSLLFNDPPRGHTFRNPPPGVAIHYTLKRPVKGEITLEILDENKQVIRTMTSEDLVEEEEDLGAFGDPGMNPFPLPIRAGLHRVVWNLRHRGAMTIDGARTDLGNPASGPLALPGEYVVRLTVEGKSQEVKCRVLLDPRQKGKVSEEELKQQLAAALKLRDDITQLSVAVEQMRAVRRQIRSRDEVIRENGKAKELLAGSAALAKKIDALEERLHNPKAVVKFDVVGSKDGAQLYSSLGYLLSLINESDGPMNQGFEEQYAEQKAALTDLLGQWKKVKDKDVVELNQQAKKFDLPVLVVPQIKVPATDAKPVETRGPRRLVK